MTKQSFASISVSPFLITLLTAENKQRIQTQIQIQIQHTGNNCVGASPSHVCWNVSSPDIVDIHKSGKIASLITVRPHKQKKYTLISFFPISTDKFFGYNKYTYLSKESESEQEASGPQLLAGGPSAYRLRRSGRVTLGAELNDSHHLWKCWKMCPWLQKNEISPIYLGQKRSVSHAL